MVLPGFANGLRFINAVGGGGSAEYAYVTTATDVSSVSGGVARTFASVNIGAADADRVVVVVFSSRTALTATVSAFSIGGVAATSVVGIAGGAGAQITMYRANVPTGTTGNIAITLNQTSSDGVIHVYRIVPGSSATPVDTASGGPATTLTVTANDVSIATGGFLIVGAIESLNDALSVSYNGTDTPVANYGSTVVNFRSRLSWSADITETVTTNDAGATKPGANSNTITVVAASWN